MLVFRHDAAYRLLLVLQRPRGRLAYPAIGDAVGKPRGVGHDFLLEPLPDAGDAVAFASKRRGHLVVEQPLAALGQLDVGIQLIRVDVDLLSQRDVVFADVRVAGTHAERAVQFELPLQVQQGVPVEPAAEGRPLLVEEFAVAGHGHDLFRGVGAHEDLADAGKVFVDRKGALDRLLGDIPARQHEDARYEQRQQHSDRGEKDPQHAFGSRLHPSRRGRRGRASLPAGARSRVEARFASARAGNSSERETGWPCRG